MSPSTPHRSRRLRLSRIGNKFLARTPHPPVLFALRFGLAFSPFARCYSGNHCCFLFLPVLRCFSSERSQSGNDPGSMRIISPHEEVPLRNLRINGFVRLPAAYRCLPRPSSASQPSHPPATVLRIADLLTISATVLPVAKVSKFLVISCTILIFVNHILI